MSYFARLDNNNYHIIHRQHSFNSYSYASLHHNQGTTEIMLALGLSEHMAGTAYLDDHIWSELEDEYNQVWNHRNH